MMDDEPSLFTAGQVIKRIIIRAVDLMEVQEEFNSQNHE